MQKRVNTLNCVTIWHPKRLRVKTHGNVIMDSHAEVGTSSKMCNLFPCYAKKLVIHVHETDVSLGNNLPFNLVDCFIFSYLHHEWLCFPIYWKDLFEATVQCDSKNCCLIETAFKKKTKRYGAKNSETCSSDCPITMVFHTVLSWKVLMAIIK